MTKLIFGCGYLGRRVARLWREAGNRVVAVTRSECRAEDFQSDGIEPIVGDICRATSLRKMPDADTVLFSVGFDRAAGASLHNVYVAGLRNVLDRLPASVWRFLYISTTGVYGEHGDEWVDEDKPCDPRTDGARAHFAAEQVLRSHPIGERAIVLRMAGLYGPGRVPRRKELLAGEPIAAPAEGYVNLMHIDDAAAAVVVAGERGRAPRTYNVSDGHPAPRGQYLRELAAILGAPPPRLAELSAPARTRGAASKRVSNRRILEELGIELAFPTFGSGLRDCVDRG
jgi:nucleoside-diphosphate-sugar epimerase